jgi:SAM-dependent methyltransferase
MSKADIIRSYQQRLADHGPGSEAVQYSDRDSHFARFEVLGDIDPNMGSVLDVGCGLADFCHFLRARGNTARYHGIDIVPEFVELAATALADDVAASVSLADAEDDKMPSGFDYAVLSGVFNNLMDDNWGFMTRTLRQMWAAADKGIAFNAMSSHVDYRDEGLFYVDPMQVFAFCKDDLGGHPVLRHDYVTRTGGFPFEFAMYVWKAPRVPSEY